MELKGKFKIYLTKKLRETKFIRIKVLRGDKDYLNFYMHQEEDSTIFASYNENSERIERAKIKKEYTGNILMRIFKLLEREEYKRIKFRQTEYESFLNLYEE